MGPLMCFFEGPFEGFGLGDFTHQVRHTSAPLGHFHLSFLCFIIMCKSLRAGPVAQRAARAAAETERAATAGTSLLCQGWQLWGCPGGHGLSWACLD